MCPGVVPAAPRTMSIDRRRCDLVSGWVGCVLYRFCFGGEFVWRSSSLRAGREADLRFDHALLGPAFACRQAVECLGATEIATHCLRCRGGGTIAQSLPMSAVFWPYARAVRVPASGALVDSGTGAMGHLKQCPRGEPDSRTKVRKGLAPTYDLAAGVACLGWRRGLHKARHLLGWSKVRRRRRPSGTWRWCT